MPIQAIATTQRVEPTVSNKATTTTLTAELKDQRAAAGLLLNYGPPLSVLVGYARLCSTVTHVLCLEGVSPMDSVCVCCVDIVRITCCHIVSLPVKQFSNVISGDIDAKVPSNFWLWGPQDPERQGRFHTQYSAYIHAAKGLDGKDRCLLLLDMERIFTTWCAADVAARLDDLPCFLYAHDNGADDYEAPAVHAAEHGALSIIEYGIQHKKDLWARHYDYCVDSVWNKAMSIGAGNGHLACVRLLHTHGVRLWECVQVIPDYCWGSVCGSLGRKRRPPENLLQLPESRELVGYLWGVLRYGQLHGAPVPESVGWLFQERQERAREVMLCFHSAARLSKGGGEQARMWGVMADVPVDVVYIILVKAELEIEETFKPRIPQVLVCSTG